jgi:hypothetical protein
MLSATMMARLANSALPIWLWEILASVGVAARIRTVFGVAIVLGILIATKMGNWNPWIAAAAACAVLLFVVLPVRLWWSFPGMKS